MPYLTKKEAFEVSDALLLTLYGDVTFHRWRETKYRMKFQSEQEYVTWLMDLADQYGGGDDASDYNEPLQPVKLRSQSGGYSRPRDGYRMTDSNSSQPPQHYTNSPPPATSYAVKSESAISGDNAAADTAASSNVSENVKTEDGIGEDDWLEHDPQPAFAEQPPTSAAQMEDSYGAVEDTAGGGQGRYDEVTLSSDGEDASYSNAYDYDDSSGMAVVGEEMQQDVMDTLFNTDPGGSAAALDTSAGQSTMTTTGGKKHRRRRRNPSGAEPLHLRLGRNHTHSCTYCDFTTSWKDSLGRHVRAVHLHHVMKTNQCPHCHFTSARKDNLKRHMRKHTSNPAAAP